MFKVVSIDTINFNRHGLVFVVDRDGSLLVHEREEIVRVELPNGKRFVITIEDVNASS